MTGDYYQMPNPGCPNAGRPCLCTGACRRPVEPTKRPFGEPWVNPKPYPWRVYPEVVPPQNPVPDSIPPIDKPIYIPPRVITEEELDMQRLKIRELELQLEILKAKKEAA